MMPGFAASMLYLLAGWPLPPAYVMVYPACLVLTAIMDRGPESVDFQIGQRLLAGAVLLLGIFYVSGWLYVSYTPAGCPLVRGIQGRYFFPLLVPALSILWMRKGRDRSRPLAIGYAIIGVSTVLVAVQALLHRFY